MVYSTKARALKDVHMRKLWTDRLRAATDELEVPYATLVYGLNKSNIMLSEKVLSDLAIWEPRTFESLTKIAVMKEHLDPPVTSITIPEKPEGVITRGML